MQDQQSHIAPQKLVIAYAGSLNAHTPGQETETLFKRIKTWFWDYRVRNIQQYTRSGYFLFRGLQRLNELHPEIAQQIEIQMWGMIKPENQRQVNAMGIGPMVKIEGYYPKEASYERLRKADLLFLPLETPKGDQAPLFIPGKLYEYLHFGKPILALGTRSDCVDILQRSKMAILCNPFAPDEVAQTLKQLVENRAQLATQYQPDLEYIQTNFSFSHLTRRLSDLFEEVLQTK